MKGTYESSLRIKCCELDDIGPVHEAFIGLQNPSPATEFGRWTRLPSIDHRRLSLMSISFRGAFHAGHRLLWGLRDTTPGCAEDAEHGLWCRGSVLRPGLNICVRNKYWCMCFNKCLYCDQNIWLKNIKSNHYIVNENYMYTTQFVWINAKCQVLPRFELGSQDSESWVLTITP